MLLSGCSAKKEQEKNAFAQEQAYDLWQQQATDQILDYVIASDTKADEKTVSTVMQAELNLYVKLLEEAATITVPESRKSDHETFVETVKGSKQELENLLGQGQDQNASEPLPSLSPQEQVDEDYVNWRFTAVEQIDQAMLPFVEGGGTLQETAELKMLIQSIIKEAETIAVPEDMKEEHASFIEELKEFPDLNS